MQSLSTSPTWLQTVLGWIASFLSGVTIIKLVDIWLNRKKPAAEIEVKQATATEITVRSHSTAGDSLARMMDRLDLAQTTIDRLRDERDNAELRAFDMNVELRASQNENEQLREQAKLDNYQLRKMMAFIETKKGLKEEYIDLDRPKEPQG